MIGVVLEVMSGLFTWTHPLANFPEVSPSL